MGIPSNPIKPGTTVQGKISWFGGPHDPSAGGAPASGLPITVPGIALYNRATLGGYWRVTAPNGRTQVVRQTDLGPAPFTGRAIDFTYSSLPGFGYSEGNFPTDGVAKAVYLGRSPNGAVAASPSPSRGARQAGASGPQSISVPSTQFDQAGFQQAQNRYLVGNLIRGNGKSPYDFGPQANVGGSNALFSSGLLPTSAPTPGDYQHTVTSTLHLAQTALQKVAGTPLAAHPGAQPATSFPKGVTNFGGKPVAKWIAPILQYARAHGWTGSVTSGFRSFADQQRIYNSGVRPAAVPGTSNHEGDAFPRGAVDVSNAQQLSSILQHSPYASVLVWAGGKDPVHFSHPHNGSY